eukprot:TRINITY_DN3833_c0_g1_i1.p1 TRINITY_DN3833_c0_g1~~TRINITY_DN3833_c0_g1_i1.p1  ORF type:complete len:228 (+),score=55.47 TRINITY_DN3833_c0_g1_i1:105-788(+)
MDALFHEYYTVLDRIETKVKPALQKLELIEDDEYFKKVQNALKKEMRSIETAIGSINIEMEENPKLWAKYGQDVEEKTATLEKYKDRLADFAARFKAQSRNERENMGAREKVERAAQIQEGDLNMLDGVISDLDDATKKTEETLEELYRQRETFKKTDEKFDQVADGLKQSKYLLNDLRKRIMRDNCIRIGMILLLLCVIGLIVYSIVEPILGGGSSSQTPQDRVNI